MKPAFLAAALAGIGLSAHAASYKSPDYQVTAPINTAIMAGNCKNALGMMKAGVREKHPDALLLGGTMFENGTCMKADPDRAVTLYQLAEQAGNFSAIPRLMAFYAHPGRDNGLALWYAAKRGYKLGKSCETGVSPDDTEAFNSKLERMRPEVYRACVYTAGVLGEVIAQGYFPHEAARHGLSGRVNMAFRPAVGLIEWETKELILDDSQPRGVRDLALVELENPRAIKASLVNYLKSKGQYALSRYQKPEQGFDPDTVIPFQFVFTLE